MTEDRLIELIDPTLRQNGSLVEDGEAFRQPPLDVIRYYQRAVRVSRVPIIGRGVSVVSLARQPVDVEGTKPGYKRLLTRIGMAANGRFPPWRGLVLGLCVLIITPEPIEPADDAMLREVLDLKLRQYRAVPVGLIRLNLGQEAIALAVKSSPDDVFSEPLRLADTLTQHFRRYVPTISF
jgi:hypothetical protein